MLKSSMIIVALVASTLTTTAIAQSNQANSTYYDSPPWTVKDARTFCILDHAGNDVGSLRLHKASTEATSFTFTLKTDKDYYTPSTDSVRWRFDENAVPGHLLAGRFYQLRESSREVEALFRRANTLTITHNEEIVAKIDLKGSAAAFRKVEECANQYPNSTVPMVPPPAPPLPPRNMGSTNAPPKVARSGPMRAPMTEGVLPPNREVAPIAVNSWFANDMHKLPDDLLKVTRIVGFSVLVNEQGRVDACDVTSSSGSQQVDDFTCRVIARRARFDPQTDENGKPVPARFSSRARWELPEAEPEPLKEGESD